MNRPKCVWCAKVHRPGVECPTRTREEQARAQKGEEPLTPVPLETYPAKSGGYAACTEESPCLQPILRWCHSTACQLATAQEKRKRPSPIPCLGYEIHTPDMHEYNCRYRYSIECDECIVNGGDKDPRTGRKVDRKRLLKQILRLRFAKIIEADIGRLGFLEAVEEVDGDQDAAKAYATKVAARLRR